MNLNILEDMGFKEESELVRSQKCPFCKQHVDTNMLRDQISHEEYKISGLCQKCQDEVWGEE